MLYGFLLRWAKKSNELEVIGSFRPDSGLEYDSIIITYHLSHRLIGFRCILGEFIRKEGEVVGQLRTSISNRNARCFETN